MADKECSVKSCDRKAEMKGWCELHYRRHLRGADLEKPIQRQGLPLEERFWQHVDKRGPDECWEWTGRRTQKTSRTARGVGYGQFVLYPPDVPKKKTVIASRLAYTLHHGKEPENLVLHTCDNPPCCNPDHLYDGTHKDNARDRDSRGRNGWATGKYDNRNTVRGTRQHLAKLDEEKVREIRRLYATGRYSQLKLGEMYGINQSNISEVVRRKTWAHVD